MHFFLCGLRFSSVQSLSCVRLFATPWIAARQASLSITISQSSPRLKSIESVMPSSHLILGCPLLLLPPIPPSIRVFSNESTLRMRWTKYWFVHYGEQWRFLKTSRQSYYMTPQSHSWTSIQRKAWSENMCAPQCPLEHCLHPRHGCILNVHR